MTREEFIQELDNRNYSYNIEGDKIAVTEKGTVDLQSLPSLPPGVVFNNGDDVALKSLIGGWFSQWEGNIKGVDSKKLLNFMVSKGIFEK